MAPGIGEPQNIEGFTNR